MAVNFSLVERSQEDISNETKELFDKCEPYLKEGWGLIYAITEITGSKPPTSVDWYRRLKQYCREKGYLTQKTKKSCHGKYYYLVAPYDDKFAIKRVINYEEIFFGIADGEEKAKSIVKELNECEWDKSQFDRIKRKYDCKC